MVRYGAVDVAYPDAGGAVAALVVASDRRYATIESEHVVRLDRAAAYRPGHFYERELPAIRAVLAGRPPLDLLIIDSYVDLDPNGQPGLGAHVHHELGVPVIGVAKTRFRTATHSVAVHRGTAARPLYVTARGLALLDAAELVTEMAGPHRLPDALRRVDAAARAGSRAGDD